MGVLDMAMYRVKKLFAWAIAVGIVVLLGLGVIWLVSEVGA